MNDTLQKKLSSMKSYRLLLLSNYILRIFFLFYLITIAINLVEADGIHDSSIGITIDIDNVGNQSSENHDAGSYQQSVSTVAKNGLSKKVEELVIDEGFILTALKQQQNENERGINSRGSSTTVADSKRQQNSSFARKNFIIYNKNKEVSLPIHNSKFPSSLINRSILNDSSSSIRNSIKWKFLDPIKNNVNDHNSNRRKRWANEEEERKGINDIIEALSSGNFDSATITSDEILTSQDYHISDDVDDVSDSSRFRIPVENIVIVGSDADDIDDDDDNNGNSKGTTFEDTETTDSYEQMSSVEENGKDDENTEMGIVRIAPEMLPKDNSMEYTDNDYGRKVKPTMHYLESKADETTKSDEIMETEKGEGRKLDELEKLKEMMDDRLLKTDMIQTKNRMLREDDIDLVRIIKII